MPYRGQKEAESTPNVVSCTSLPWASSVMQCHLYDVCVEQKRNAVYLLVMVVSRERIVTSLIHLLKQGNLTIKAL